MGEVKFKYLKLGEQIVLKNEKATSDFAKKIAEEVLAALARKGATVVALSGDLGAGKTVFAKGFAKALGIKNRIFSPTFMIFRSYRLKAISYKLFYHVDVYRIKDIKELDVLGFGEILKNPQNIVLIEWADKIKEIISKDAVWLEFKHGRSLTERVVMRE